MDSVKQPHYHHYIDETTFRQLAITVGELVAMHRRHQQHPMAPRLTRDEDYMLTKAIELKSIAMTQLKNAGAEPR